MWHTINNVFTDSSALLVLLLGLTICGCNGQDAKLASFAKQEHRFEVRDCEFFYNGEQIELYHPKSYYEERFGTNYKDMGTLNFYIDKPLIFRDVIRSLKKKNIRDVTNILIKFWDVNPDHKNYDLFQGLPFMKEGQYILIDGIPFGHGVSIEELNSALRKKGKLPFSSSFAGSSGIKARGFTSCENFPLFSIAYDEKGKLQRFSYLINKPKHLH